MTFGILRLGDAVQRWLCHHEPSSWSCKSTIKEKLLYVFSRVVDGANPYKINSKYNRQTK